jgi:uncharacterized protein (TIGR02611 family)
MSEPAEPLAAAPPCDESATASSRRARARARAAAWRAVIRRNRVLNTTWRVIVFMVGSAAFAAGLAGLIFPVLPGWALIFIGLAVLATEFAWAERALARAKRTAGKAGAALRRRRG